MWDLRGVSVRKKKENNTKVRAMRREGKKEEIGITRELCQNTSFSKCRGSEIFCEIKSWL